MLGIPGFVQDMSWASIYKHHSLHLPSTLCLPRAVSRQGFLAALFPHSHLHVDPSLVHFQATLEGMGSPVAVTPTG